MQPLLAFDNIELNGLALCKRSVALGQNRALMHENVAPALALDEAVALVQVKPFHCSLFFAHRFTLFFDLRANLGVMLPPVGAEQED